VLVAYLLTERHPAPTVTELRRSLAKTLPEHMIPSVFVMRHHLPLTPTGKVDKRSLPDPGKERPELDGAYVSPTTPIEETLAQIWSEVLSLDRVGIYDSFFDLGGHSLAATRVISQVFKQFRLELPLQSLFTAPTVAEMAAVIVEHQAKKIDKPELERILAELESISEEKARQFLGDAMATNTTRQPDE